MTTPQSRPRVLVIAEEANPEWVSVPLVGWSLASALRDVADVHIVTQVRNREAIQRAGLDEGRDFTAIDSEALAAPMYKLASLLRMGEGKGWTTMTAIKAITYPYFEWLVWQRFGADICAGTYDIVHRITPLSPTTASPLAAKVARAGVPFVLGPLNGGVPWPRGFDAERRREREWLSYIRGAYKLNPQRGRSLRSCAAILAGSQHTASELPPYVQDRVIWLPENAIDPARFNLQAKQDLSSPMRACFIGRLVPYKGPDMLLAAAAEALRSGRLVLDMIGDGPMRADLEAQAEELGITQFVTFHGNLAHERVQTVAAEANLLTFPSIREFGGGVVLEAMALGVVPMVMDYGGPGELVTEDLGYKVPIGTRAEIVTRFSALLEVVLGDPSGLPARSKAARARVQTAFTWPAKARQVAQVYDWVLEGGALPKLMPEETP
jgi:glycosyltransferase involved in cell wall biosynthesis